MADEVAGEPREVDSVQDLQDDFGVSDEAQNTTCTRHKRKDIDRTRFLAILSASSSQPRDLECPQANRTQLYQTVSNLYMPHDGDHRTLMSILTISETSQALYSASKTIGILLLHRASGEARLLHEATGSYSDALRHARREANDPRTDKCTLIGTAHFLSLCELFQRVSLDDPGITRPHARWLISFMESHRGDTDDLPLQRMVHSNVRLVATWEMLVARKSAFRLATSPHDKALAAGTVTSMSDLTLLTTNMLEDSDELCLRQTGPSASCVFEILGNLVALDGTLHSWMATYLQNIAGSPYRLIEATSLPYPTRHGTRSLLRSVYDFIDLQVQILFISYWMCHLMLVDARIDIVQAHVDKLDTDPKELVRLKSLASEYASHLSKSMPTLGRPYAAGAGKTTAVRPLHLLLLHYRRHKDWQKLSWCVECARDIGVLVDKPMQVTQSMGG